MRYKLRTLMIVLALGPPMVAWVRITAHKNYGLAIIAASLVVMPAIASPVVIAVALLARRRYLLDFDRRQLRRSGLFSDRWPDKR